MSSSVRDYMVQARRGSVQGVYEVASQGGLAPRQLGVLAQRLRELDPSWRLSPKQRHDLIARLLEADIKTGQISELADCHRATVKRCRDNLPKSAEGTRVGPSNPHSKRVECCKTARPDLRVGTLAAGLHFDASS